MKKLIIAVFVLSLVALPSTTRAGFFDFFKINQKAQVTSAVKSDSLVTQLQKILFAQGIYKGNADGYIGSKTISAIKTFQRQNKLPVTGLLDKTTVDMILQRGGGTSLLPCTTSTRPHIKVTSPNGGEVYQPGQTIDVTWTSCNIPAGSQMFIAFNAGSTALSGGYTVVNSTPDDGIEQITLPPVSDFGTEQGDWFYGLHYKIGVGISNPADNNDRRDYSDNLFSIVGGVVANCTVTTEQTNPFVSSVLSTNVSPFSESFTNLYNEMSVFRIQNPTNCPMSINKMSILSTSTDGLEFVEKADLRLKTLDDGNVFSPTNIGPNYTDSNAYFTILDTIPANSYKEYSVGTSDINYFDPYSGSLNMNWGGIAVGVGQVDFEVGNLSLPSWNGNTVNPSPFGPVWGPVITVQQ